MPIPTEPRPTARNGLEARGHRSRSSWLVWLVLLLTGCGGCGEPSVRELKNQKELNKDIHRIDERHASGELSDESYHDLQAIAKKAQAGDWGEAEKQAYELRESKPFFK